jgi:hypothetical protein
VLAATTPAPNGRTMFPARRLSRLFAVLAVLAGIMLPALVLTASPAAAQNTAALQACEQVTNPTAKALCVKEANAAAPQVAAGDRSPELGVRPGSVDFLPAWRWQNVELDQDQGGILGAVKSMPNSIALILFALANVFWLLLLNISRLGLSADFITPAAPAINSGVAQFSTLAFTFGAAILAIVFYRTVVKGFLGKKSSGSIDFRELGVAVLLMAFIMGLGNMSSDAAESYASAKDSGKSPAAVQEQQANYVGTLPWAIRIVTGSVDDFAATLSTGWGLRDRVGNAAMGISEASDPADQLTCVRYIDELHNQYLNYKGAGGVSSANPTLAGMSRLWESTFYRSWTTAMFSTPSSTTDIGARVMCHYADATNSITPQEQAGVAVAAYDGFPNRVSRIFWDNTKEEDDRRAVVAWGMCKLTADGFGATTEFSHTDGRSPESHAGDCKKDDGPFGTKKDGLDADNFDVFGNSEVFDDEKYADEMAAARKWEHAWFGQNPAERLLNGFLALAVSMGMLWALGFMAIGLVFVQFTLVVLLLLFPLILAAIVVTSGERRDNAIGLLKLIGTSVFTKFFFALILSILIEIAAVGQAIVDFLPGGGGLFGQVLKGLMPLAALFIMRKILAQVGMGDILRPTGAVSFATKAAAMTTRNEFAGKVGSTIAAKSMRMTGANAALRKADRYSPELANWNKAGRKKRAELNEEEKQAKLDRRKDEREERGNGALDRIKDWANAKGWDLDKVDDLAATAAKGGLLAAGAVVGAPVIAAGGAPALLAAGGVAGEKGRKLFGNWQNQRKARENVDVDGAHPLREVPSMSATAAEAEQRAHARARQSAYASGRSVADVDQERVLDAYQGVIASQYGSDFTEFADENEAFATRAAYAQSYGYQPEQVMVGMDGMLMPVPVRSEDRTDLSVDQLGHWVHWIDDDDKEVRVGESSEQYMQRLFSVGVSRGLVGSSGQNIDVWSKMGLDMSNGNDRRRVEGWLIGDRKDDLLSQTVFQSRNSSAEAAMVATVFSGNAALPGRGAGAQKQQRELQQAAVMQRTVQHVRSELSSRMGSGDAGRGTLGDLATRLGEAQARGGADSSVAERKAAQELARSLSEELRSEVEKFNRGTFELVQDLVASSVDLRTSTGELRGIDEIEKTIAAALSENIQRIEAVDEVLVQVLNGREAPAELLRSVDSLRSMVRAQGAAVITEADRAGKYLDDLNRRGRLDQARIGDSARSSTPIRRLVEHHGSSIFPSDTPSKQREGA